jgi:hypothetical protein
MKCTRTALLVFCLTLPLVAAAQFRGVPRQHAPVVSAAHSRSSVTYRNDARFFGSPFGRPFGRSPFFGPRFGGPRFVGSPFFFGPGFARSPFFFGSPFFASHGFFFGFGGGPFAPAPILAPGFVHRPVIVHRSPAFAGGSFVVHRPPSAGGSFVVRRS